MILHVVLELSFGELAIAKQEFDDRDIFQVLIIAQHHTMQASVTIDAPSIDVDCRANL